MAIYTKTESYSVKQSTCGEVVDILEKSQGAPSCMTGLSWIEDEGDEPMDFVNSWVWLQEQRRNKKIYILSYIKTVTKIEGK